MLEHKPHAPIQHTEVTNTRGTTIRVKQMWADDNPTRDPIRHFTITAIVETYGHREAVCKITHGIDRTTGEEVPINREVRIAVDRLHPGRTGYRQVTSEGDPS